MSPIKKIQSTVENIQQMKTIFLLTTNNRNVQIIKTQLIKQKYIFYCLLFNSLFHTQEGTTEKSDKNCNMVQQNTFTFVSP